MKVSIVVTALATTAQFASAAPGAGGMSRSEVEELVRNNWKRMDAEGGYEVKGAGWHHERYLNEEAEEINLLKKKSKRWNDPNNPNRVNLVAGVVDPSFAQRIIMPRREIRDLDPPSVQAETKNVRVMDLLVLALNRWWEVNSQNNPVGYWQLAGVHGQPFMEWNGDGRANGEPGGPTNGNPGVANAPYCTHGSTLFPPWHRPYLALVEEQIFYHAKVIATQAIYQKWDWRAALKHIRLPYYDPGANAGYPGILQQTTYSIAKDPMTGKPITVRNPFYEHRFTKPNTYTRFVTLIRNGNGDIVYNKPWFSQMQATRRCPTSPLNANSNMQSGRVRDKIWANRGTLRSRARQLLLNDEFGTWQRFSNKQGGGDSLESLHDILHVEVGENGHMSEVFFSSFDPIFWLHHANVDRLYAMWQAIHPSVGVATLQNQGGTYGLAPGSTQGGTTPLRPWRNTNNVHWTGNTVANWTNFGYSYLDVAGPTPANLNSRRNAVRARANALYPNIMQSSASLKKRALQRRDGEVPTIDVGNNTIPVTEEIITGIEDSIVGDKYSEWRIDITVDRTAVGGSFSVRFFIGKPPKNVEDWAIAPNLIGSYSVLTHSMIAAPGIDPTQVNNTVGGSIPITDPLIAQFKDGLHSLQPGPVVAFLQSKLRWRVEASGVRVPVRRVKDLKVSVSRADATLPSGDDFIGKIGEYVEVGQITRGIKEGGDTAPGILPPTSEHATEDDRLEARRLGRMY